jgi:recombination protein RecA
MAKKKNNDEIDFFSSLAKSCGGETLDEIGSEDRGFVDTGVLSINYLMSGKFVTGGVPVGSLVELFGPSSSGKSLLAMNIMKGVQKADGLAVYIDAERAVNKEFAIKASKVDPKKMVILYPDTLKNAFYKINTVIMKIRENPLFNDKPIVIIYDSIAASPSDEEFAETKVDMENDSDAAIKAAGARLVDQPGVRAKTCSKELRKLMSVVADNKASVVFINQIRQKIGVLYGNPQTTAGGGESLPFYCSTRIELRSKKEIKAKGSDAVKGINTDFNLKKSRFNKPRQKAEDVGLLFDHGIDPFGGLLGAMLNAERIEPAGKGIYKLREPWADGKEVKFSASKDKNLIPVDILLENPQLVDAKSKEEVQYYIDMYSAAMGATNSDMYEQTNLPEELD